VSCKLTFVYPVPDATEVYDEGYFTGASECMGYANYDEDKKPMVPTFEKYLKRIARLTNGKRLLDVGAATGFFLEIAKREGFEVAGVEISSFAAEVGRKKGIPMTTGTLADVPATSQFDVITAFDVLEHVGDPEALCKEAHALLAPGGLFIINTPDIGSVYAQLLGKRWNLIIPPEHLFYFSGKTVTTLLTKTGFEVVEITRIGKNFSPQFVFKTLYVWQGLGIWKYLSEFCANTWLRHIALPINLRDNMFVVARKKT
jgi:2-polyprenyl-3-methyl-5-hydroxy-6-metoxy-1,4-benzoquinol methylase